MKIGILGRGCISRSPIRGYEGHPDCSIVAVADIDEDSRPYWLAQKNAT